MDWDLKPGETVRRTELQERFRGSAARGISAPASGSGLRDIMLFWGDRGEEYGYRDGWSPSEEVFFFSGMGQHGDQQFGGGTSENGRVLNHASAEDHLRLLKYVEKNMVKYLGEFQVDAREPFVLVAASDSDGLTRQVIRFRLRPIGQHVREPGDTVREVVADAVGTESLPEQLPEPSTTDLEALNSAQFMRGQQVKTQVAVRRELQLVHAFRDWLAAEKGLEATGLRIPYRPEGGTLHADAYVPSRRILIEAKSSANREDLRAAIGQLLDYARYLSDSDGLTLCTLSPSQPAPDMVALVEQVGTHMPYRMGLVWQDGRDFVAVPAALFD